MALDSFSALDRDRTKGLKGRFMNFKDCWGTNYSYRTEPCFVFLTFKRFQKNLKSLTKRKTKIVKIWTKFFISREILKAQKMQTTFWKCLDYKEYFVIINSIILLQKCRKLYQKSKMVCKSSCLCHVWLDMMEDYYDTSLGIQLWMETHISL